MKLPKKIGVTGMVLVTAGAVWVLALRQVPDLPDRAPPGSATHGAKPAAARADVEAATKYLPPAPPEPTFSTAEQTLTYYGALLEGERKALVVIEEALRTARSVPQTSRDYLAHLEAMRTEYRQRIERHQTKLAVR